MNSNQPMLKSCPFCNGEAERSYCPPYFVGCKNTTCCGFHSTTSEKVWNSRIPSPTNEELKKQVESYKGRFETCEIALNFNRKERDQLKVEIEKQHQLLETLIEYIYCERAYQKMYQVIACPQDDCECCNCSDVRNTKQSLSPTITTTKEEKK